MTIYGVALLAFCYVLGQAVGEFLGKWVGVEANVGGVGFAMLLLIFLTDWLHKNQRLDLPTASGIQFWNQMYIPIVVAMSAIQNVKLALSSGMIAVLGGIVPVLIGLAVIPWISRLAKKS